MSTRITAPSNGSLPLWELAPPPAFLALPPLHITGSDCDHPPSSIPSSKGDSSHLPQRMQPFSFDATEPKREMDNEQTVRRRTQYSDSFDHSPWLHDANNASPFPDSAGDIEWMVSDALAYLSSTINRYIVHRLPQYSRPTSTHANPTPQTEEASISLRHATLCNTIPTAPATRSSSISPWAIKTSTLLLFLMASTATPPYRTRILGLILRAKPSLK